MVGISWSFGWDIDIPGIFRLTIHYVGANQPFYVSLLTFVLFVSNSQKAILSLLIVSSWCISQRVIPVKIVICLEIAFDAVEIDQNIVKLFEQEEATCHTLSSRYSVALGRWSANELEQLLSCFQMFLRILFMAVHQIRNSFNDIFSRVSWLKIFDQIESLLYCIVFEVINNHV